MIDYKKKWNHCEFPNKPYLNSLKINTMEEIEVTIKLSPSKMRWRTTWGSIRNDEGNVVGGLNGAIEVEVEGKSYSVEAKDIWNAVVKSLGKNHLVFGE